MTSASKTETFVGLTVTEFKARFRNHQVSFNNETRKNDTELSKYIWRLTSKEQRFTIKRKILAKAKPYSNLTKRCNLCTAEKFFIITKLELTTLNKWNDSCLNWFVLWLDCNNNERTKLHEYASQSFCYSLCKLLCQLL